MADFAALAEGRSKAQADQSERGEKNCFAGRMREPNVAVLRRTKFLPINFVKAISYW
ncbi:hypothetical protein ACLB1R_15670 [Escherichia coli]